MESKGEVFAIEFTLKKIFEKDKINKFDVDTANKLFCKWKILTNYKENEEYPSLKPIIDEEPIYKNK